MDIKTRIKTILKNSNVEDNSAENTGSRKKSMPLTKKLFLSISTTAVISFSIYNLQKNANAVDFVKTNISSLPFLKYKDNRTSSTSIVESLGLPTNIASMLMIDKLYNNKTLSHINNEIGFREQSGLFRDQAMIKLKEFNTTSVQYEKNADIFLKNFKDENIVDVENYQTTILLADQLIKLCSKIDPFVNVKTSLVFKNMSQTIEKTKESFKTIFNSAVADDTDDNENIALMHGEDLTGPAFSKN